MVFDELQVINSATKEEEPQLWELRLFSTPRPDVTKPMKPQLRLVAQPIGGARPNLRLLPITIKLESPSFPSQAAECYYGAEGVWNSSIFVFGCIVYTDPLGVKPTTQALSRHHRIVDFCAPSLLVSLRLRCWRSPAS